MTKMINGLASVFQGIKTPSPMPGYVTVTVTESTSTSLPARMTFWISDTFALVMRVRTAGSVANRLNASTSTKRRRIVNISSGRRDRWLLCRCSSCRLQQNTSTCNCH